MANREILMDTHIKYLKVYTRLTYQIYVPMYGDEEFLTILGKHFRDSANEAFVACSKGCHPYQKFLPEIGKESRLLKFVVGTYDMLVITFYEL